MAYLYVLNGPEKGRSFRLREGENYIGRSIDNDIRIEDKTLSRKHARILLRGSRFFITDLKSQNRTFFDSAYIEPGSEVELKRRGAHRFGNDHRFRVFERNGRWPNDLFQ